MGTNDEKGRAGKGSRRERGRNRRKARSRVQMTHSDRAKTWEWEVRVRQMETQRRRSWGRMRITSFGNRPTHTQDALIQTLKPSKEQTGINIYAWQHNGHKEMEQKSTISPKWFRRWFRCVVYDHIWCPSTRDQEQRIHRPNAVKQLWIRAAAKSVNVSSVW